MSSLQEVNCPACAKAMRFQASGNKKVALNCPACGNFFQVQVRSAGPQLVQAVLAESDDASPTPARPTPARPAPARPAVRATLKPTPKPTAATQRTLPKSEFPDLSDIPRPVIPSLHHAKKVEPLPPILTKGIPIAVASILICGALGYFGFQALKRVDLAAIQPKLATDDLLSDSPAASDTSTDAIPDPAVGSVADASQMARSEASSQASMNRPQNTPTPPWINSGSGDAGQDAMANSQPLDDSSSSSTAPRIYDAENGGNSRPSATAANNSGLAGENSPSGATDFGSSTPPSYPNESLADLIERSEKSVVRIEVDGADGASLGSGFVVDSNGTLVTNCHVLAGARMATAHFPDGRKCLITGTFVIDEARDIVVAKLSDTSAPPMPIALGLPRKGEQVTALGAPHGLSFTATRGIISAIRSESEMGPEHKGTWVQVDAALSPGNSGGPLINSQGEVVGMSTLASQGSAQNLNFGISSSDIATAIDNARHASMLTLAAGVGGIRMSDGSPDGPRGSDGPMLTESPIADEAFAAYIQNGLDDFPRLVRGLRSESARMSGDLKEMRNGSPYIPGPLARGDAAIVRTSQPGRRNKQWYFASREIKEEVIEKQLERIRRYGQLKSQIRDQEDFDSVHSLLMNYGPQLNPRDNGSIGFVSELFVIHAFNGHDVLVLMDDTPYLLWAPSTAGLSIGEIIEGPVFVAGTSTASSESGLTAAVTVLQLVSDEQIKDALSKVIQPADGYRTWSDRTGEFTIEAKLLGQDSDQVVLQKRDGSIVNVPRSKLSQADVDHLESR